MNIRCMVLLLSAAAGSWWQSAGAAQPWQIPGVCAEGVGCPDKGEKKDDDTGGGGDRLPSDTDRGSSGGAGDGNGGGGDYGSLPGGYTNQSPCGSDRRQQALQKRLDAQRTRSRKRHHPEFDASQCPRPELGDGDFGGFHNDCNYDIEVSFCVLHPDPDSWSSVFDCEKQSFGVLGIQAHDKTAAQIRGGEEVLFGACTSPQSSPLDAGYEAGTGQVRFRCNKWSDLSSNDDAPSNDGPGDPTSACTPEEKKYLDDDIAEARQEMRQKREAELLLAEQKKRQALAAEQQRQRAAAPVARTRNPVPWSPGPASPPGDGSPPSISDCRASDALISEYVQAQNAWAPTTSIGRPISMEAARQRFDDILQRMRHDNPQNLRAYAARDQAYMDSSGCGSHAVGMVGISGPQARMSCAETRANNAMRLCVADRLEHKSTAPIPLPRLPVVPAPASRSAPTTSSGASCAGGLAQNERDFGAINARRPANATLIQNMQVALYMTSKMMSHLDAACRGQPQASQYNQYKQAYDQTMAACRGSVTSTDVCVPRVAW